MPSALLPLVRALITSDCALVLPMPSLGYPLGSVFDRRGGSQGVAADALPHRRLHDTPWELSVVAAATDESDLDGSIRLPSHEAVSSTVQFVDDSAPAHNALLTKPDGPMLHNKALYDAGHNAVRVQRRFSVCWTFGGVYWGCLIATAPAKQGKAPQHRQRCCRAADSGSGRAAEGARRDRIAV